MQPLICSPHSNNCCLTVRVTVGGYMESYANHDRYSFIHNDNCCLTFLIPANSQFKVRTKLPNSHSYGGKAQLLREND